MDPNGFWFIITILLILVIVGALIWWVIILREEIKWLRGEMLSPDEQEEWNSHLEELEYAQGSVVRRTLHSRPR